MSLAVPDTFYLTVKLDFFITYKIWLHKWPSPLI